MGQIEFEGVARMESTDHGQVKKLYRCKVK